MLLPRLHVQHEQNNSFCQENIAGKLHSNGYSSHAEAKCISEKICYTKLSETGFNLTTEQYFIWSCVYM